ncbi:MAG: anaerobic ribonucleoside-triphosphate reductase activating protein [Candidatus Dojkabacteria bacterium]|nr:anaerobic ribonucleoside-triphosphate reductase activating protein [Candidatus Dojkabacteria bacterium]
MLRIGGLEKSSLLDYPDKISTVIFLYGCNLRCRYCHNPELVTQPFRKEVSYTEKEVLDFLRSRIGKVDGVVITGGEPLIQRNIEGFIRKIKKLGLLVKLDTNGFFPNMLSKLIKNDLIDYISMDVKYSEEEYLKYTGNISKVKRSIKMIMDSGIDYEFRTTYINDLHTKTSAEGIGKLIKGAKRYYIQNFRPGKCIDENLNIDNSFLEKELKVFKRIIKKYIKNVYIR